MSKTISTPQSLKRSRSSESNLSSQDENVLPQATPKPPSTFGSKLEHFKYETSPASATNTGSLARRSPRLHQSPPSSDKLTTPSPSPLKRLRAASANNTNLSPMKSLSSTRSASHPKSYAPPSKYAHLSPLTDTIVPNLLLVFIYTTDESRGGQNRRSWSHHRKGRGRCGQCRG